MIPLRFRVPLYPKPAILPPHRSPPWGGPPLAKPPSPGHIRLMPHRVAKTFGSRAEPRAVTGEQAGLPLGADRRPPGFGEAPQPLMQEHPLVSGAISAFTPHRPPRP